MTGRKDWDRLIRFKGFAVEGRKDVRFAGIEGIPGYNMKEISVKLNFQFSSCIKLAVLEKLLSSYTCKYSYYFDDPDGGQPRKHEAEARFVEKSIECQAFCCAAYLNLYDKQNDDGSIVMANGWYDIISLGEEIEKEVNSLIDKFCDFIQMQRAYLEMQKGIEKKNCT